MGRSVGSEIKSLWDSGNLDTMQIAEITGLPEWRVYAILAAYSRERYAVKRK